MNCKFHLEKKQNLCDDACSITALPVYLNDFQFCDILYCVYLYEFDDFKLFPVLCKHKEFI